MRRIRLSNGKYALVDDDLWSILHAMKPWSGTKSGYAVKRLTHGIIFMHKFVLELSREHTDQQGDHRDENKLNNQRHNLRPATNTQNARNRGPSKANTSGYKGVTWSKANEAWSSSITDGGRAIFLGYYDTARKAAIAYDREARSRFGAFAKTNFARIHPTPRRITRKNATGFTGVRQKRRRFEARIRIGGEVVSLGWFDTAEEASEAYELRVALLNTRRNAA